MHRLAEEIAPREEVETLCECGRERVRPPRARAGAEGLGAPGGTAPTGRAGPGEWGGARSCRRVPRLGAL